MRYFVALTLLALTLIRPAVAEDQKLFTEIGLQDVYSSSTTKTSPTRETAANLPAETGMAAVESMLKELGFKVTQGNNGTVSITVQRNQLRFLATLSVGNKTRLMIEMPIAKVGAAETLDSSRLLAVLSVGDQLQDVFVSFNRSQNTIKVQHVTDTRVVTSDSIRIKLIEMATVAEKQQSVWKSNQITAKKPSTTTSPRANSTLRLAGIWTATVNKNEAFALQIQNDQTFQLVHQRSGKSSVSKGKWQINGQRLALNGDQRAKIAGQVTQTAADAFQLTIGTAPATLVLKFKSAK